MALMRDFRDPPAGYRFAPFWFWNHELSHDELERQILEMKAKGFGGFIMHARHGLHTPYMGEAWMAAVEHASRVALREKMWAWLYDEDNWPSGTVGMRLAREKPEHRMSQLHISDEFDLSKGESVEREIVLGDELFCALAVPMKDGEALWRRAKGLARRVKNGVLKYTAGRPNEKVLIVSRSFFTGAFHGGYLDVLNKAACAWFLRETHDKYAERLKSLIGRSVKGIFTDEPAMWMTSHPRSVAFTPELPKRFEREHEMPFSRAIVALFFDVGKLTSKIRLAYHQTVTRMYVDAFFKPTREWCDKRKVRLIGHPLHEGEFAAGVKNQGDYFAVTGEMHYAGVDALFDATFNTGAGYGPQGLNNHLACKLASSAEHLLERERTMCESFGAAAGWELTLPTLKRLGDFQVALGVNYFMPHAAYYSIAGFRKWECPPDESYHVSYWPFYREFADHLARLSTALHGGQHIAPVAVLSPVAAMAAALNPGIGESAGWIDAVQDNPQAQAISRTLYETTEALSRHQMDFDLLNEDILTRGRIGKDGQLEIRGKGGRVLERFRALVLPHVTALSRKTVDRIEEWAKAGLPVGFVGPLPEASGEEGLDDVMAGRVRRLMDRDNVWQSDSGDADMVFELTARVERDIDLGDVRDIIYLMKDKENRRLVFLANTSRERGYEGLTVRVRASGVPHLMDTRTGKPLVLPYRVINEESVELRLDFPPAASHLVMFARRRGARDTAPPRLANVEGSRLTLADAWRFTAEGGNYFPLRHWSLDIEPESLPENKWSFFRKRFRTEFHAAISPSKAVLLADGIFDQRQFVNTVRPDPTVYLNDHLLEDWSEGTHYDRLVPETDVTPLVRQGMNELVVVDEANFSEGLNLHQAMLLAGDFTVAGHGQHEVVSVGRSTIQTGSWAAQGFPYFSGIGRYEQEFDLPKELAGQQLFLEFERAAHVVEVTLNGRVAGVLPWPPYRIDVTESVRPKRNRLVLRIANTMANVFLLRPEDSGLLGKVSLVAKQAIE